jgi:hypothetical protein
MYIIGMKKLSLLLALACLIASNSFAERKVTLHNGRTIDLDNRGKRVERKDVDCSRYEVKDDDQYYRDGKLLEGLDGNTLLCGSEMKGWDKARQRYLHREQQLQNSKPNKK